MYDKSPTCAVLLFCIQLTVVWHIAAVEVYTSRVVEAVNGTDVRLKCTFSSFSPVFYFHEQPYPPTAGHFKNRVAWDGNVNRNDVSIIIWKLQFNDNGTFTCQVKNPPDVDGVIGEIRLSVVQTARFSEVYFLALAIGSACALMVLIVIVVVLFQHSRKRRWTNRGHVAVEIES
ncbi:myelin protein zero-like protein 2 isoform X3 [Notamacropus eugenii]|uniref:myelin protein zero-like protein 2 isoform X3 n=1 Tax=Notamacropus eugenii TaxID=9315 RepID=UPI003B66D594